MSHETKVYDSGVGTEVLVHIVKVKKEKEGRARVEKRVNEG